MQPVSTTFVVASMGNIAISATGICSVAAVAQSTRFVHARGVSSADRSHFPPSCRTSTVNAALYPSATPSPVSTALTATLGAISAIAFAARASDSVPYSIGKPGVTAPDCAPTWMYSCSRPSTARPIRKLPSCGFLTKNSFVPVL